MFDWTSRDGVSHAPWGFSEEEGDHIVPYPTAGEIGGGFGGDCAFNGKEISESCIDVRGGGLEIDAGEDVLLSSSFTSPVMETGSGFCATGSTNLFGADPVSKSDGGMWSCSDVAMGGSTSVPGVDHTGSHGVCAAGHGMLTEIGQSGYAIDSSKPTCVDDSFSLSINEKVEFGNNSGVSVNGYEKCGDFFLDCDWSITDFDDPDGIFSDSMFWDGQISKMDGISSRTDSLNATSQQLPIPGMVNSEDTGENLSSFFQDGESLVKIKHSVDDKMASNPVSLVEQTSSLSRFSSRNDWSIDVETDKVGRRNKLLKSGIGKESTPETKIMSLPSRNINSQIRETECVASVSQMFPSGSCYQDKLVGVSCNSFSQCGLAGDSHFMVSSPSLSPFAAAGNVDQLFPTCTEDRQVTLKHPFLGNNEGVTSGAVHLNPQEKIEKLKRRQQMQAMLAIEMQQKQLNDNMAQGSNQNSVCSGQRMRTGLVKPILVEQTNLPNIAIEPSVTETIFCQLGNIISKLDDNLKMCMRDSLFRLARSASERMGAEDRSSTITGSNYEDKVAPNMMDASRFRQSKVPKLETEPETNRVDRIVALLLFNKHQQTFNGIASEEPSRYKSVNLAQM